MGSFRCAGLIYGPDVHHLDHLAPLCILMNMPLIVTEENIASLAQRYYAGLHVQYLDYLKAPEYIVSHFELLFYSIPRDLFEEVFFLAQTLMQKRVHTIWCPHGNSDKGHTIFYMEGLYKEELALIYGKQMLEFLKQKNVFNQLKRWIITGNYRYQFYLQRKEMFDLIVTDKITSQFKHRQKTLLYAPTWRDYENSSSFFDAIIPLLDHLPHTYNLIVKLHPNLLLQEEIFIDTLLDTYRHRDNLLFLTDFPLIYPLLNVADVYIGDMSSIGYDFLTFNKPMFFLNQNLRDGHADLGLYLFRCGIQIQREEYQDMYKIIEHYYQYELRDFATLRTEVYTLAFGPHKPLDTLVQEIRHCLEQLAIDSLRD